MTYIAIIMLITKIIQLKLKPVPVNNFLLKQRKKIEPIPFHNVAILVEVVEESLQMARPQNLYLGFNNFN